MRDEPPPLTLLQVPSSATHLLVVAPADSQPCVELVQAVIVHQQVLAISCEANELLLLLLWLRNRRAVRGEGGHDVSVS